MPTSELRGLLQQGPQPVQFVWLMWALCCVSGHGMLIHARVHLKRWSRVQFMCASVGPHANQVCTLHWLWNGFNLILLPLYQTTTQPPADRPRFSRRWRAPHLAAAPPLARSQASPHCSTSTHDSLWGSNIHLQCPFLHCSPIKMSCTWWCKCTEQHY